MILQENDPYRGPSFSLGNRLLRALWGIVYILLFRPSPRTLHFWRIMLLRLFGAKIGRGCHFYPNVKIWAPWNLKVGNHSGVGDGANLYCMDKIEIGDFVAISQGAVLCGGTHDYNSKNFQLVAKPINVGTYAWICAEAFLHPGVVIPEGAVVGARAVVTKSLKEGWAVYAGNPCKQVALRTKQKTNKFVS
jgi:putative colanic acid biosynthesis acetyltransferase WcaF